MHGSDYIPGTPRQHCEHTIQLSSKTSKLSRVGARRVLPSQGWLTMWPNYAGAPVTLEQSSLREGIEEVQTLIWWLAAICYDGMIATT